jgi:hypothetical protein
MSIQSGVPRSQAGGDLAPERTDPGRSGLADPAIWQVVQDRVLAYVTAAGVTPPASLELAYLAVQEAREEAPGNPLPAAMAALHRRLAGVTDQTNAAAELGRLAQPPISRGHMVPEKIDRRPWYTALVRFSVRLVLTRDHFYYVILLAMALQLWAVLRH